MKTQDIIKYALIAAAAYLAYRWAVGQGLIPDLLGIGGAGQLPAGGGGQIPAGSTTGAGNGVQQPPVVTGPSMPGAPATSSSGPGSNAPAGGTVASGSIKESVQTAAWNESTPNAGLLHFWKWNYYLPGNVPKPNPFDVDWAAIGKARPADATDVETTPLNIDQWWTLVQPFVSPGVSGMGQVNHWQQQSSQWYGGQ